MVGPLAAFIFAQSAFDRRTDERGSLAWSLPLRPPPFPRHRVGRGTVYFLRLERDISWRFLLVTQVGGCSNVTLFANALTAPLIFGELLGQGLQALRWPYWLLSPSAS
jgi:hypothetical protein